MAWAHGPAGGGRPWTAVVEDETGRRTMGWASSLGSIFFPFGTKARTTSPWSSYVLLVLLDLLGPP